MLKQQTILEVKKNDRIYQLHLSNDSPLGECFDVLREMQFYILSRIEEATKSLKPTEEAPKEENGNQ